MSSLNDRFSNQQSFATTKTKILTVAVIVLAVILAFFIQNLYLKHQAAKAVEKAYQEALEEANVSEEETIIITEEITVSEATLREVIAPVSELGVYKYYYTDTGVYEKNHTLFSTSIVLPFTTDKTIYTYTGVISAGINLEDIKINVDNDRKNIDITLPTPKILHHEMDDDGFQIYDVKNSIFTSSNLEEFKSFENALMETQEKKLESNNQFWNAAKQNCKSIISNLINISGTVDGYTINYDWHTP